MILKAQAAQRSIAILGLDEVDSKGKGYSQGSEFSVLICAVPIGDEGDIDTAKSFSDCIIYALTKTYPDLFTSE